tara:strand:- start:142 stop:315 length:174 start_codon:yes stop_codon:yes gene_type:complete
MWLKCSECDAEIVVPDDSLEGELVTCPDCGSTYEIRKHGDGPMELRSAKATGEDWGE